MLRAILFVLALLIGSATSAQTNATGWAGYVQPGGAASNQCSPLCTSMSASWIVPSVSQDTSVCSPTCPSQYVLQWIGISGTSQTSSGNTCPGPSCLGQFGTQAFISSGGTITYSHWYELYCTNAPSAPCQNLQVISDGNSVAAGDYIVASMTCASNCTANNASQTWNVSIHDVTQGWTWNNSGTAFNWPLGLARAAAVVEGGPNLGFPLIGAPMPFFNVTVNSAPLIFNAPHGEMQYAFSHVSTTYQSFYPSPLINGVNSFYVCRGAASFNPSTYPSGCPANPYSGGPSIIGPN